MKCKCGGQTFVATTVQHDSGGVLRRRKCFTCGMRFSTMETVIEAKKPAPPPPAKKVYTPVEAAKVNASKVAARRKAEDIQAKRRDRVSMYYIEDDDLDKDKWGM